MFHTTCAASLDSLKGAGKPVFLDVYHDSNMDGLWRYDCKDVEAQANGDADFLKAFMEKHGDLKGIILADVDLTVRIHSVEDRICACFQSTNIYFLNDKEEYK